MTRLDELVAMRATIDAAIEQERRQLWAVAHLRDEVEELLAEHSPAAAVILEAVSQAMSVSPTDLVGRSRDAHVVDARHVAAWLLRHRGLSFPEAGRVLHRDHATIMHSCRRVAGSVKLGTLADQVRASLNGAAA